MTRVSLLVKRRFNLPPFWDAPAGCIRLYKTCFFGCINSFSQQLQCRRSEHGALPQHVRPKWCHSLRLPFTLLGAQCLSYICCSWAYRDLHTDTSTHFVLSMNRSSLLPVVWSVRCVCVLLCKVCKSVPWSRSVASSQTMTSNTLLSAHQGFWTGHVLWGHITQLPDRITDIAT